MKATRCEPGHKKTDIRLGVVKSGCGVGRHTMADFLNQGRKRDETACVSRPLEPFIAVIGGAGRERLLGALLRLELFPVCTLLRYGLPQGLTLSLQNITLVTQDLELAHADKLIAKLTPDRVMPLTPVCRFILPLRSCLGLLPQFGDLVRRRAPRELVAQGGELLHEVITPPFGGFRILAITRHFGTEDPQLLIPCLPPLAFELKDRLRLFQFLADVGAFRLES